MEIEEISTVIVTNKSLQGTDIANKNYLVYYKFSMEARLYQVNYIIWPEISEDNFKIHPFTKIVRRDFRLYILVLSPGGLTGRLRQPITQSIIAFRRPLGAAADIINSIYRLTSVYTTICKADYVRPRRPIYSLRIRITASCNRAMISFVLLLKVPYT